MVYIRKVKAVKKRLFNFQNNTHLKKTTHTKQKYTNNKQTFSAPLLAEEEAAEGSGAGGADVLSKSSSAPGEKER